MARSQSQKRRKRAVLAATGSCPATVKAAHEMNCTASPFLRLPSEIRNRIYALALANKTIHIATYDCPAREPGSFFYATYYRYRGWSSTKARRFAHTICQNEQSESEIYDRLTSCSREDGCGWAMLTTYRERHETCLSTLDSFCALWKPPDYIPPSRMHTKKAMRQKEMAVEYPNSRDALHAWHRTNKLDIGLLRVCRLIHKEAALIPYAENTFAFESGYDFDLFISEELIAQQRKAIQHISLSGWLVGYKDFLTSIRDSTVLSLQNLRSVELALTYGRMPANTGWTAFYGLGLESVKVVVTPSVQRSSSGELLWRNFPKHANCDSCRIARNLSEDIERKMKEDDGIRSKAVGRGVAKRQKIDN